MLNFELQPLTEPGRRFVEACEQCAETFAGRAAAADRAGKFPVENIDTLRSGGLIGAAVPEEFGGMGVDSLHDLALGVSRLGRADSAMAIAYNMHLTIGWSVARFWRTLQLDALADQLKAIAAGQIIAIGGTEAGTSLSFPLTTAVPDERGWRINGRKIFGTLSPVTDHFVFAVRVDTGDGNPQVGNAFAPANTPGLTVLDNWDALGMRASGSNDLVLEDVIIPADALIPSGPWGVWNIVELQNLAAGNIVLIGAFLGIAETARDIAVEMLRTRKKVPDADVLAHRSALQHGTAEMEIGLATMRACISRTATVADEYFARTSGFDVELADAHQLMKEFQCAKYVVNRTAIEVVDKAMELSGGAGYFSSNPLSRLYRDVRAGPFMQPFSPNEAFEYIGKVALGVDPDQPLPG